jgi:hypothetical protein
LGVIGKLKSTTTRTVHAHKVVRLKIDLPYQTIRDTEVNGDDALAFLNVRTGKEIGVEVTALEDQSQAELLAVYEKL